MGGASLEGSFGVDIDHQPTSPLFEADHLRTERGARCALPSIQPVLKANPLNLRMRNGGILKSSRISHKLISADSGDQL
jgi:hypothetical protein